MSHFMDKDNLRYEESDVEKLYKYVYFVVSSECGSKNFNIQNFQQKVTNFINYS